MMIIKKSNVHVCAERGVFALLTGVVMMMSFDGCAQPQKPGAQEYVSRDPKIGIAAHYPAGWSASESRGSYESYAMVVFYEPERGEKGRRAEMVVSVVENAEAKTGPALEDMVADILARRRQLPGFRVLSQKEEALFSGIGFIVELAYRVPVSLKALERRELAIREKAILFAHGTRLYQVRYTNTEDAFPGFAGAFDALVASIRFLSEPA